MLSDILGPAVGGIKAAVEAVEPCGAGVLEVGEGAPLELLTGSFVDQCHIGVQA